MSLKSTKKEVGDVTVLQLEGTIVLGEESNVLRFKIKELLTENKKKVVLNMSNVMYVDSAGQGTLVASFHSANAQGCKVVLCSMKGLDIIVEQKLVTTFEVYDNEEKAVGSFSK